MELLSDDENYLNLGLHKGDRGTIVEDYAIKDCVIVDFGRMLKGNGYSGDCIVIRLKDLRLLKMVNVL